MIYLVVLGLLILVELAYFRLADRFNIIDKPNHRSSHTQITIRGGGVVFYFAALTYFIWSGWDEPYFFLGLTLMALISFLDDIFTLSNKLRITVHLVSVLLLIYQVQLFSLPWFILPLSIVMIIGIINAYNFMDGINGITAMYSFAVLGLLWLSNLEWNFVDERFILCIALGNLVFTFFNFRQKAKCFAGDVGSVSMAFILVFLLALLIIKTGNLIYLLFLAVYGLDTVWTIVRRLKNRENIFEAHRSHLYQYLANEARVDKLLVSTAYGLLQLFIGLLVLLLTGYEAKIQLIAAIGGLAVLSAFYLIIKSFIIKKYKVS